MSDNPGFYDASDPAAVDALGKEKARREAEDLETIRIWMNHPHGRALLWRITQNVCHLGQPLAQKLDGQSRSDPLATYLELGERNVGCWLDDRMRLHPELYMKMLQEQEIERQVRDSRLKRQNERKEERDAG